MRLMIFIGWVLSAFSFVIALAGLATPGAGKLISLALIGWCLIFLPPLWLRTIKHGLPVNIVVRVVAFFTLPVIFAAMATAIGYKPAVSIVKTQPEASSTSVSPTPITKPLSERVTPKPATSSIAVDPTSTNDLMQSGQLLDETTSYTTSEEINDVSTGIAKRFTIHVKIPPGRTREEVRETFKRAMRDLLRQRDADAAMIWSNAGKATYAPDGDWSKASNRESNRRVTIDFEASYFKPPVVATKEPVPEREEAVTMDGFKQLEVGMSYSQVVEILGKEGEELSRGGEGDFESVVYQWNGGSMSNITAMFQADEMTLKSQFGLSK